MKLMMTQGKSSEGNERLTMKKYLTTLVVMGFAVAWTTGLDAASRKSSTPPAVEAKKVEMFTAMEDDLLDVRIIPKDSTAATVLFTNKTDVPLSVALPDAFVAVHAQIGGGGFGGGGGGGLGGAGGGFGGGGGGQAAGGGFGGGGAGGFGGGGGGIGGGGGGFFSVPPEKVRKIKLSLVCLEHGKPDPNPRMKYEIRPISTFTDNRQAVEVCKMLGRREISQNVAQAAAWHLLDDMGWDELARKNRVALERVRYYEKYFSIQELGLAQRVIAEAVRRTAGDGTYRQTSQVNESGHDHAAEAGEPSRGKFWFVQTTSTDQPPLTLNGSDSTFLDSVENQQRLQSEVIQADIENELAAARRRMQTEPELAIQNLKLSLEGLLRSSDLDSDLVNRLAARLRAAIREAGNAQVTLDNRRALAQENRAAAREADLLVEQTTRDQERVVQLLARFNSLLREARYDESLYALAENQIAEKVRALQPNAPISPLTLWNARNRRNVEEMVRLRDLRHRQFVNAMYTVEDSAIPFPDDEPIIYPDRQTWQTITRERKKYASVDLAGKPGSAEQRIATALQGETDFSYLDTPLRDVLDDIQLRHDIPIIIDASALEDYGVGTDTPVTMELNGITLKSALRLMLSDLDLTYIIQDEVMQITTVEEAESKLITKVYPVGDLVIPVGTLSSGGGGGGFGGGLGGGGLGGGGFGGGGLGGGGFGGGGLGGGGGGFGGGGGGFFGVRE